MTDRDLVIVLASLLDAAPLAATLRMIQFTTPSAISKRIVLVMAAW
jgi:hypothetical protein